jgi:hypothetical protein
MYESVATGTDLAEVHATATPLGRLAQAEEIAEAAVWLCAAEASYVTALTMSLDGDGAPETPSRPLRARRLEPSQSCRFGSATHGLPGDPRCGLRGDLRERQDDTLAPPEHYLTFRRERV